MNKFRYNITNTALFGAAVILGVFLLGFSPSGTRTASCETPRRLVIIQGKVRLLNHPTLGTTDAVGTLVFQKVGCDACYIGADIDAQGKYEILVGDGKYRVMYVDPIEDVDYLAPDQPRFIDTEIPESKKHSQRVFDFDVKLQIPEPNKSSS